MPSVELRGWPDWTEDEDLKAVIEGAGHVPLELRLILDASGNVAVATFAATAAAGAVAAQLNGFEFTPGYPLLAKAVADPLPAGGSRGAAQTASAASAKGAGKGPAATGLDEGVVQKASDFPVSECLCAGRIEGWFLHGKAQVDARGWGHVQSFSFEGNLLFRPVYSPLLQDHEYKHQDAVTFEVIVAADGRHQAVRLALAGQEELIAEHSDEAPWEDPVAHELEAFIAVNRKWLQADAEEMLRGFSPADQHRVISVGTMQGVRDPCKVMHTRILKAKEACGEIAPYEVRKRQEKRMRGEYSHEEWTAWHEGRWPLEPAVPAGSSGKRPTRDETWGNEAGTGVFFGGLNPDVDEVALRAFAEAAGTVTFVKIFMDYETGVSRGCGKVFYKAPAMAQRAIEELHKTEFFGRPVTAEILGDENRKKRRRPSDQGPQLEGETEEGPKLLPLSYFDDSQTVDEKINLCIAAFEDLLVNHDPVSTGKGTVWMVRSLIREINEVFEGDNDTKQEVVVRFRKHQWFWDNEQQIKWQASKSRINLSKVSPSTPAWKGENSPKEDQEKGKSPQGTAAGFVQAAQQWAATMNGIWGAVRAPAMSAHTPRPVAPRVVPNAAHSKPAAAAHVAPGAGGRRQAAADHADIDFWS